MEEGKINSIQLFVLIVMHVIGTALVVMPGMDAEKDAWISIFIGMVLGMILLLIYAALYRMYPADPLTTYAQKILGRWLGWPIGMILCLEFINVASRNLKDYGSIMIIAAYDLTPFIAINFLLITVVAYILYKGFETLARTGEIFFMLFVAMGVVGSLFIFSSDIIDTKQLHPILEKGWGPVLKAAVPLTLIFPFGEINAFMMLFPFFQKPDKIVKVGLFSLLFAGIVIIYSVLLNLAVLGPDVAQRSTFPLLTTVSMISYTDFIQRLDVIAVFTLIIGNFFKISIYYYAAVVGIADLFQVKNRADLVFPIGLIILFGSVTVSGTLTEHLEQGLKAIPRYVAVPMQVYIPLLLLIVARMRQKFGRPHKLAS